MRIRQSRSGYALVIVLVLITVLLSLYGVAYRHMGAALRIETVRTSQAIRDTGSMEVLARGLALLETGVPPTDPYVCAVAMQTPGGARSFTLTFTKEGSKAWAVRSAPTVDGSTPAPMPASFFVP